MRDFFEQQGVARRRSSWLVVYLLLAAGATVLVVYFGAVGFVRFVQAGSDGVVSWWHPVAFQWVSIATVFAIFSGSAYKMWVLRSGGRAVAAALGGRLVDEGSREPLERRLLNIADEMAVAAGISRPAVYVMPGSEINALAAGRQAEDVAIGVTEGALDKLARNELQGVVAHEIGHIVHGDARLNLGLMGIVHGLLVINLGGWFIVHATTGQQRNGVVLPGGLLGALLGGVLVFIGAASAAFASIIKAGVSRQREFLADAAAVQYTRNPDGIAGALRKIRLDSTRRTQDPHARETSHMWLNGSADSWLERLMATHPAIEDRLRRLGSL